MNQTLQAALHYLELGFSVIPCNNLKKPYVKWEPYQSRKPTTQEVTTWWEQWPSANVAIVTGMVSNVFVMDIDGPEGADALESFLPDSLITPTASTPRGGKHLYFACPDSDISIKAGLFKQVDFRGNHGYVMAPPSMNGNGKHWSWVPGLEIDSVERSALPIALYNKILKESSLYIGSVDKTNAMSTTVYKMFVDGTRDDDLFRVANALVKGGLEISRTNQVIEILAKNCEPEFPVSEVQEKIKSAIQRAERRERNLAEEIREWVCLQSGYILSTDVHNCLQLSTREEKKNASIIMKRLCEQGVIEKYGDKAGCFKKIDRDLEEIDWESANDEALKIELPFNIHEFVEIMPKNIVVIAGVPNAGKTCFLLNTAIMNVRNWPIRYLSSEMDGSELKKRLKKFEGSIKQWKPIKFYRREEDFANAIDPDGINIIDFLEITDKFYLVAERLREYHNKLKKGVLFLAIQKDPNKDYGRGGNMGLEKPRLYLNLDPGVLKIVKAKNWARETNPNGLVWRFKLVQGSKFIIKEMEES